MGTEQLSGRFRFVFFFGGGRSWRSRCLAAHMSKAVHCVCFLKDCDQWTTRLVLAQLSQRSNAVTAMLLKIPLVKMALCKWNRKLKFSTLDRLQSWNRPIGRTAPTNLWYTLVWFFRLVAHCYDFFVLNNVWTLEAAVTLYFVCVFGCYHICAGANGCGGTIREPPSCPRISKNTVFIKVYKNIPPVSCTQTYRYPLGTSIHLPLCICITCVIT